MALPTVSSYLYLTKEVMVDVADSTLTSDWKTSEHLSGSDQRIVSPAESALSQYRIWEVWSNDEARGFVPSLLWQQGNTVIVSMMSWITHSPGWDHRRLFELRGDGRRKLPWDAGSLQIRQSFKGSCETWCINEKQWETWFTCEVLVGHNFTEKVKDEDEVARKGAGIAGERNGADRLRDHSTRYCSWESPEVVERSVSHSRKWWADECQVSLSAAAGTCKPRPLTHTVSRWQVRGKKDRRNWFGKTQHGKRNKTKQDRCGTQRDVRSVQENKRTELSWD